MHLETFNLSFMCPNNGQLIVLFLELGSSFSPIVVRTTSNFIELIDTITSTLVIVNWVTPKLVTEHTLLRGLFIPIHQVLVLDTFKLRGNPSMYCYKSSIDYASKGKTIERVHQHIIYFLIVLINAFSTEVKE